jgi:hypothetical protein
VRERRIKTEKKVHEKKEEKSSKLNSSTTTKRISTWRVKLKLSSLS